MVAAETDGRLRMWSYDAAGQLVGAADPTGERRYGYDPAGRLSGESGPGGERGYRYDAAGQLRSSHGAEGERSYRYDDAGRRVAEDGPGHRRRYRWDGFGRLTGIDTGRAEHAAAGRRARRAGAGRRHPAGLGQRRPDGPAGRDRRGHPARPRLAVGRHRERPARTRLAADPGRGGGPRPVGLGRRAGWAWATAASSAVDGLLWLRQRAYDPATRAFLQPDPLPPIVGTAFAAHPYHYAGNDPVNAADPLGRRPVTDAELAGQRDEHGGGGWLSDLGHGLLDVAGLIPVVGEAADLANAGWYALEGDYLMAGLSAASAIPFLGYGATAAKVAVKGGRAVATEAAEQTARGLVDDVAEAGARAGGPRIPDDATVVRGGTVGPAAPGRAVLRLARHRPGPRRRGRAARADPGEHRGPDPGGWRQRGVRPRVQRAGGAHELPARRRHARPGRSRFRRPDPQPGTQAGTLRRARLSLRRLARTVDMIDETRLRDMRARAEAASGDAWRLDQQDGHPVVRVEAGGRPTGVLRLMRDLDPAGLADVDFVAHARTDLDRLIAALTGGPDLPAATGPRSTPGCGRRARRPGGRSSATTGGVGGSNVIWVSDEDDQPDLYLWLGESPAPNGDYEFVAYARDDIPALLAELPPA